MRKLVVVAAAILGFAAAAHADTITVTAGAAGFHSDGQLTSFDMEGPGTLLSTDSRDSYGRPTFHPGDAVVLSGSINPVAVGEFFGVPAEINGVSYPSVVLTGSASFISDSFIAPVMRTTSTFETFAADVPFVLSGHFNGFTFVNNLGPSGSPVFSVDILGNGVFHDQFTNLGDGLWFDTFGTAFATFNPPPEPSPTPEPATMILVATALAGSAFHRRRRQTRS